MTRPQHQEKKAHCQIHFSPCDHYHVNAELSKRVLSEHLATSRGARKHILYEDNRPEVHNISSTDQESSNSGGTTQGTDLVRFTHEVKIRISSRNIGIHFIAVLRSCVSCRLVNLVQRVVISSELLTNAQHRTSDAGQRVTFFENNKMKGPTSHREKELP